MPHPQDRQLGTELRLHRPAGDCPPRVLESMVRDLIGSDPSLLAPLLDLVGRPGFQALNPSGPAGERMLSRDALLNALNRVYTPQVLERLAAFLDGYCNLGEINLQAGEVPPTVLIDPPAPQQPAAPTEPTSTDSAATPVTGTPPHPSAFIPRSSEPTSTSRTENGTDPLPDGAAPRSIETPTAEDPAATSGDPTANTSGIPSAAGDAPRSGLMRALPLLIGA
ncbi:MAG: hypothetical protein ACKO0M_07840, partial [Cyanobium sp.]